MAEEGPMAQISLAGSKGALKGCGGRDGGREKHAGGGGGEEHKDRGRQTVKQGEREKSAALFMSLRKFVAL